MIIPRFLPTVEVRKLGGNCSRNCLGCKNAIKDNYNDGLELSKEQNKFIQKIKKVFNFQIEDQENITLGFAIPFSFDKISFEEFKKTILDIGIDKSGSFGFMVSDTINNLNNSLEDILKKLKYIFELNIKNTGREKNSTITLISSKGGLKEIDRNKERLLNPIQKITNLCKGYVKDEIALQIGRLVISEDNYNSSQIEAKNIIDYLYNQLNEYKAKIQIEEKEDFSEYNIIIDLGNSKKIIIHLALIKQNNNYKESIEQHLKNIQSIGSTLLLSTIDEHIQVNHSLGKINDKKNLITYEEINEILEELNTLKQKLINIDFLKDINPIFFILQKIKLIKEMSIRKNIVDLLKNDNTSCLENESMITTISLIDDSKMDLIEHTKKGLLPAYILGTYLRIKLILLLEEEKDNI